jgi:hypothetical protein
LRSRSTAHIAVVAPVPGAVKTIRVSTHLDAEPDIVRQHVMTPALLDYVVAGLMAFRPIEPKILPSQWLPGRYKVKTLAFHLLPIGWQTVKIELPDPGDPWFIRDNGSGSIARVWDHRIFIEPEGAGTRYVDEVSIDAGILTRLVALYARFFYTHRQRRWRKLVRLGFRPLT